MAASDYLTVVFSQGEKAFSLREIADTTRQASAPAPLHPPAEGLIVAGPKKNTAENYICEKGLDNGLMV